MLVIALVPASALAGSSGSSHATPQNKQQTTHTRHLGAVVQALGSGYSSRHGSGGVRALQHRLVRAGYAPGPIDGRYGPRTEQAVSHFQAAHGLQVDGIAGPLTFAALSGSPVVMYPGTGYSSRHGSGGVRALQHRLVRAGYAPGPIDGRYGPRTEQAVSHFQAAHGLQVDGIAGAQTLAHLGTQRMRHKAISHSRLTGSHQRVNRPARGGRSRRHTSLPRAGRAPAPIKVVPSTPSTRSPSLGLIVLLLAFAVALGLAAMWLAYRRRNKRYASVDPQANGASRPEPADAIATHPVRRAADRAPAPHWTSPRAPQATGNQRTTPNPESIPSQTTIPDPEADRAFNLALQLEKDGDQTEAIAAYQRADRLGHAAAANTLGVLLEHQGERAAAEACFRRADQRGNASGAFNLAVILAKRGDHTGALTAYRRADQLGYHEIAEKARPAALARKREVER
jgi:peptidoglycan hydrolase-like protein with peptidoglycan-binding domain